jgi:3-deoxy-7-phosphoheptulonate synthase
MNYLKIKELISYDKLQKELPLSEKNYQSILAHRKEIQNIITNQDKRLLMIIGPCSAWPNKAVYEYAKRLAKLNEVIKSKIKIVMRVYPHKSRTTLGWTGALYQPDLFSPCNINEGIKYTRSMLLEVIELNLAVAAEAICTQFEDKYWDLFSWLAIGARSSESQEHRIFASAFDIPFGIKNPTHGNINIAINAVLTAQHPHCTILSNHEVKTLGNPYAHLVLRGANNGPNYSENILQTVYKEIHKQKIVNPSVLIDVSHDNSILDGVKNYKSQPSSIFNILEILDKMPELKNLIKGFMIESFIKDGNQVIDYNNQANIDYGGLSITDPCIDWETTEETLLKLYKILP